MWRYVLYDHTSAGLLVRYYESAGESQAILAEFLLWAWGKSGGPRVSRRAENTGVGQGQRQHLATIKSLLEALEVTAIEHAAGNARVKGGVEVGNNIVETKFESRLRFEPVHNVEQLNHAVLMWQNAFNADLIPRENNALRRRGMVPVARYDLWRRIRQDELRVLPEPDVPPVPRRQGSRAQGARHAHHLQAPTRRAHVQLQGERSRRYLQR